MESTPAHIFMDQKKAVKRRFEDSEHVGPSSKVAKDDEFKSVSNMAGDKAQKWNSFWVPELTTTAEPDKVAKPTGKVLNPMNGKPIKFKDLMSVIFTPIDERATTSLVHSMEERYKCPVTGDALTNANRAAYLKTR
jgi:nitric oxide synthase-interacting protein